MHGDENCYKNHEDENKKKKKLDDIHNHTYLGRCILQVELNLQIFQ